MISPNRRPRSITKCVSLVPASIESDVSGLGLARVSVWFLDLGSLSDCTTTCLKITRIVNAARSCTARQALVLVCLTWRPSLSRLHDAMCTCAGAHVGTSVAIDSDVRTCHFATSVDALQKHNCGSLRSCSEPKFYKVALFALS